MTVCSTPGLRVYPSPDATVAAFSGEIDFVAAKALRHDVDQLVASRPKTLLLDLTAVDFLDSSGLAMLLRLQRELAGDGMGCVTVTGASRAAWHTLELCGLLELFGMEPRSGVA